MSKMLTRETTITPINNEVIDSLLTSTGSLTVLQQLFKAKSALIPQHQTAHMGIHVTSFSMTATRENPSLAVSISTSDKETVFIVPGKDKLATLVQEVLLEYIKGKPSDTHVIGSGSRWTLNVAIVLNKDGTVSVEEPSILLPTTPVTIDHYIKRGLAQKWFCTTVVDVIHIKEVILQSEPLVGKHVDSLTISIKTIDGYTLTVESLPLLRAFQVLLPTHGTPRYPIVSLDVLWYVDFYLVRSEHDDESYTVVPCKEFLAHKSYLQLHDK